MPYKIKLNSKRDKNDPINYQLGYHYNRERNERDRDYNETKIRTKRDLLVQQVRGGGRVDPGGEKGVESIFKA